MSRLQISPRIMLRYLIDSVLITVLVFASMWILGNIQIIENLEWLNPIEQVFEDFDLTDIVFSQLHEDSDPDQSIAVINISDPTIVDRYGMALMIERIHAQNPKVIAIDAFYRNPLDSVSDAALSEALSKVKNLVMVTQCSMKPSTIAKMDSTNYVPEEFDTLLTSNKMFMKNAVGGHANLFSTGRGNMQDFVTVRTFAPVNKVAGKEEPAFSVKIAEMVDPEATADFLARRKKFKGNDHDYYEYINYRGNVDVANRGKPVFFVYDYWQVLDENFNLDNLKDKIVILGYMGPTLDQFSYIDKLYTPLNKNYVGRSTLDMYGVVIHANIVSMILNRDYINQLSPWVNFLLVVGITYLSTLLFSYFFHATGFWYDAITIIFQLIIFIGILGASLYAFDWFRLRLEISLAVVGVILSGIFVEIYFGIIKKFFITIRTKRA